MLCAISGEAPQQPVASRKSGNVFERRLIETHIAEHHTDPVNGEELHVEDLIELQSPRVVAPRPPHLTSIPSLLRAFQTEWDAVALESFTLKQQLAQTRQELSTALYQNDAATRVIARLALERDHARNALAQITVSAGAGAVGNGEAMEVDGQSLPAELLAKIEETHQHLYSTRKKRPIPDGWATAEDIAAFDVTSTTDALYPGSSAIAINESGEQALFGGVDGVAGVYDISEQKVVQVLKCGTPVTASFWWGSRAVVATAAGVVKIFEDGNEIAELGSHSGPVTSIALHPSGAMLASAGTDKRWFFYDLATFKPVLQIYTEADITCCSFHVDGMMFFTGSSDGHIRVYDVKSGDSMVTLDAQAPVKTIAFSETGVWFAVATRDTSSVSIWDLRKQAVIKVLEVGGPVDSVRFDYTGQFLAAAGPGGVAVQHYTKSSKSWSEPVRKAVAAKAVAWGATASSLVALTPEGALSFLGAA
ncbi:WD40 repeat-like protein [Amniculicola lignicola CBS 123094]|uniref:Pre-mRNA-processing factor 19 n=1 Tax=Amniculicola lignicola CBS 123094 TaxID=1392246 RepID=A0A6A5WQU2_9PLEO|nr:WD40 repeat-like protein [Amniculicola lignicola CBS 123094]